MRWRPRFSLRTLAIFLLLCTSAFGLWWHWRPWGEVFRVPQASFSDVSQDGRLLLVHRAASPIYLYEVWDLSNGQRLAVIAPVNHSGRRVGARAEFSPSGKHVAVYSSNLEGSHAWVIDATTGAELLKLPGSRLRLPGAFDSAGERIVARRSPEDEHDPNIPKDAPVIYDAGTGETLIQLDKPKPHSRASSFSTDGLQKLRGYVYAPEFSPDGKRVIDCGQYMFHLWDSRTGKLLASFDSVTGQVRAEFSPDGSKIAITDGKPDVRVLGAESGGVLFKLKGHQKEVFSATFSPDGKWLLTDGADASCRVWSAEDGTCVGTITFITFSCRNDPRFTRDSRHVVVLGRSFTEHALWTIDGTKVIDLSDGLAGTLVGEGCPPELLPILRNRIVEVWDLNSHKPVVRLTGFQGGVSSLVARSPDGERLLTHESEAPNLNIRVWDARTGKMLAVLRGYRNLHLLPGGELLTALKDGDLFVFRRRRPEWWWGVFWLREFWFTVVFAGALVWSVVRDRKTLVNSENRARQRSV